MVKKIGKQQSFLYGLIFFHLVANIIWLVIDKTPPAWDQAAHIRSVVMAREWLSGGLSVSFVELLKSFYAYPPLIYFLASIWTFFSGLGIDQVSFSNSLFFVLTILGVYKLAGDVWNRKVAIGAAIIFSFMPVVYDISRNFLLDLPLTVWVVWGIWFWIKSDGLKKEKYSWGWWGMLILSSLTKLNGFIYFAPMGIISLVRILKNSDSKRLKKLVLGGIVWILLVSWWWLANWDNIYNYLTGLAGQGEPLTDPMNLLSWQTWIHYIRLFVQHQAQPIPAIIFFVCLWQWLTRWKEASFSKSEKDLTWWLLAVYVIFTIINNKDFRFTLPALPIVAMIMAVEIEKLKNIPQKIVIFLLAFFWGMVFVNNSFSWPIKNLQVSSKTFLIGDVEWLGLDDYPVSPARSALWPNEKIVKKMYEIALVSGKINCLTVVNWAALNDNNLKMERDLVSINGSKYIEFFSTGMRSRFESQQEIKKFADNYDLALVPGQEIAPAPFYAVNLISLKQARDWIWQNPETWKLEGEYDIPGNEKVYLFSRK